MSKVIFWIIQLTWGLPQTILGLMVFLLNVKKKHYLFGSAVATEWGRSSGVSLGLFIFVPVELHEAKDQDMLFHEYGHTIQSLILGPVYLLIIGIPSILWFRFFYAKVYNKYTERKDIHPERVGDECKKKTLHNPAYTDFYTEKWAENAGNARRIKEERNNISMKK